MRGLLILVAALGAGLQSLAVSAAASTVDEAEMARIRQERLAVEARHAREAAVCAKEFSVTACLQQSREVRRAALDQLRRQQQVIDDARRRERAAQRTLDLERKRVAVESKPNRAAPEASSPQSPSALKAKPPLAATPAASAARPSVRTHQARDDGKDVDRTAAQRATDARARRREAEQHRADVLKRNAELDRKRAPAGALPAPSAPTSRH